MIGDAARSADIGEWVAWSERPLTGNKPVALNVR